MVLWTIVPTETVLAENSQPVIYEELEYYDQKVMVERIAENQYRVVRLLTTVPEHYLQNNLRPGTIITCKPIIETLS